MQREDVRTNCLISTKLKLIVDELNEDHKCEAYVDIINISASGIRFRSKDILEKNRKFCVTLKILNENLDLYCSIIRRDKAENIYTYGAKFIDLKVDEETNLRSYIYKLQVEQRQKSMN